MNDESAAALPSDPLWNQVAQRIRAEILSGVRPAGTRLIETSLAKDLVVSQATVRSALASLASEGLVTQLPRRGTYVAEISVGDARDVYEVRQQLETMAVTAICTRLAQEDRGSLARKLQDHLTQMERAAASNDLEGLIAADARFHELVWTASGNSMLRRMWPMVAASHQNLTRVTNPIYFGDLQAIAQTHEPLIRALEDGKAADAAVLFSEHIHEVWERLEASASDGQTAQK